jgi:hypothetical protein
VRPYVITRAGGPAQAPYRIAAVALLGVALDAVADPSRTHVPLCPLHALTGLWCPLCGSLRAVHALSRGEIRSALHDNLMLVLAAPVVAAVWIDWTARARTGRPRRPWARSATVAVVVLLAAFTVLRNLPVGSALHP